MHRIKNFLDNNAKFEILVIEDAVMINNAIKTNLEKENYIVHQAFDLRSAYQMMEKFSVDLVVLDLHLPDGNGEELIYELREKNEKAKFVIFTSDNDLSRRDELFKLGIVDYILKGKPAQIIFHELNNIIQRLRYNSNFKLLIVEDSVIVRKMIRRIIEPRGYLIVEVGRGKEALEKIDTEKPDIVLLDLELPDMSGMDILKQIKRKSIHFHLPVFIISSHTDIETLRNVYKEGASEFLKKPFLAEELLVKIDNWIDRKEVERNLHSDNHLLTQFRGILSESIGLAIFSSNDILVWKNDLFTQKIGDYSSLAEILHSFNFESHDLFDSLLQEQKVLDYKILKLNLVLKLFPITDIDKRVKNIMAVVTAI